MTYFWLGLIVVLVIVEAATIALTTIWFALGAVFALILSCIQGVSEMTQVLVFVVVSAVSLWLLRPIARRHLTGKKEATNADRVINQIGVVLEDVDNLNEAGAVKVDGKIWTARAYTGEVIPKDTRVRILFIEGVKLIVEPAVAAAPAAQLTIDNCQ